MNTLTTVFVCIWCAMCMSTHCAAQPGPDAQQILAELVSEEKSRSAPHSATWELSKNAGGGQRFTVHIKSIDLANFQAEWRVHIPEYRIEGSESTLDLQQIGALAAVTGSRIAYRVATGPYAEIPRTRIVGPCDESLLTVNCRDGGWWWSDASVSNPDATELERTECMQILSPELWTALAMSGQICQWFARYVDSPHVERASDNAVFRLSGTIAGQACCMVVDDATRRAVLLNIAGLATLRIDWGRDQMTLPVSVSCEEANEQWTTRSEWRFVSLGATPKLDDLPAAPESFRIGTALREFVVRLADGGSHRVEEWINAERTVCILIPAVDGTISIVNLEYAADLLANDAVLCVLDADAPPVTADSFKDESDLIRLASIRGTNEQELAEALSLESCEYRITIVPSGRMSIRSASIKVPENARYGQVSVDGGPWRDIAFSQWMREQALFASLRKAPDSSSALWTPDDGTWVGLVPYYATGKTRAVTVTFSGGEGTAAYHSPVNRTVQWRAAPEAEVQRMAAGLPVPLTTERSQWVPQVDQTWIRENEPFTFERVAIFRHGSAARAYWGSRLSGRTILLRVQD